MSERVTRSIFCKEADKMFSHALSLSAIPTATLDMTADLAPLFVGMVVGLGLCVLGLAFAIGIYDSRKAQPATKQAAGGLAALPKAA